MASIKLRHSEAHETRMDIQDSIGDLTPLVGTLVPLKTVQETRAVERFVDAYVAEINIKSASKALKLVDSKLPQDPSLSLSHLRRFAKPEQLPEALKAQTSGEVGCIYLLIPPPLPEVPLLRDFLDQYAFVPSSASTSQAVETETGKRKRGDEDALKPSSASAADQGEGVADQSPPPPPPAVKILQTRISLTPPTSLVQAQTWSREWWPTQYNPAAQTSTNAPPPTYVAQVKEAVQAGAGRYLALARRLGEEARAVGRGRGVGVVMVDPDADIGDDESDPWGAVVAAAGDARYWEPEGAVLDQADSTSDAKNGPDGHPEHHAMMRGIAMVSEKRLALNKSPTPDDAPPQDQQQQQSSLRTRTPPLTPLEAQFTKYAKPPSYLCTGLDAYISHEPCIMCSMGMLLSRFRSVTFPRTRDGTPGVALDPHDGYGLHWRRELNWRAVAFRFDEVDGGDGGEGVVFNA